MPDIQDQKFPYELLVRFGPDGLPVGAHVQYLRRITLDGEIIKDDVQQAEPVDIANFPTSTIMSDTCRDALAKVTTQEADIATLNGHLQINQEALSKAQADLATVSSDNDKLRTELTSVQADAVTKESGLNSQIFSLTDQLNDANATITQLQETIKQLQAVSAASQPTG